MKISTALPLLGLAGISMLFLTACGSSHNSSITTTSDSSSSGITTTTVRQGPPTTIAGGPVPTIPINPVTTTTMKIINTTTTTLKSVTTTTQPSVTTTTIPSSSGNPTLGAHTLAFYACGGQGVLKTAAINTAASGSTVLAWTGRGIGADIDIANKPKSSYAGNGAPLQIGSINNYGPYWPDSDEALYAWPQYNGGSMNTFSFPVPDADEISAVVVEVLNGGQIADSSFVKVVSGANTSGTVTTTGPATLVAIWAGDSGSNTSYATPDNGFTVIESQSRASCDVEVTVATKNVSIAGTYNVNWTPNVTQGAHLWLVAIQKK